MEFDELLVTTGVDALVRLVKQKKKIELEECARALNISANTIEDWAHVLEEEGIIRIEYRLARVYLVWMPPTQEEIEVEQKSFYEEKKTIQKEVEKTRAKLEPELKKMTELEKHFAEFYKKTYPRIEALEKAISHPVKARKTSATNIESQIENMNNFSNEIDEVKQALQKITHDVADMSKKIKGSESKKSIEKIEKMMAELTSLEKQATELRKKSGKEQKLPKDIKLPTSQEIREKFVKITREFQDIKQRNARMREDLINLTESKGILKEVGDSLKGYEKRLEKLKKEINMSMKQAKELEEQSSKINKAMHDNADLVDRFGDSLDVAKGILTRFPSHTTLTKELKTIKDQEATIQEKYQYLKKIIDAIGGRQISIKEFEELDGRIAEKIETIRSESDYLTTVLEEEKSTYLTYQNIREKIVPSLKSYESKVKKLDHELQKSKKDIEIQQKQAREELKKIKGKVKAGDVDKVAKVADEIEEKKKTLDNIYVTLRSLKDMSDSINKRLTLLNREARLLEIRASGSAKGGETTTTPEEIREKLDLTREEEAEFRRKREELKNLIKKLWEDT